MTKLKTYLNLPVIFPIKIHQTIDKVVQITNYYAEFYILHQYCAQRHCKSAKMYTPFSIGMGHVRISCTEPT